MEIHEVITVRKKYQQASLLRLSSCHPWCHPLSLFTSLLTVKESIVVFTTIVFTIFYHYSSSCNVYSAWWPAMKSHLTALTDTLKSIYDANKVSHLFITYKKNSEQLRDTLIFIQSELGLNITSMVLSWLNAYPRT